MSVVFKEHVKPFVIQMQHVALTKYVQTEFAASVVEVILSVIRIKPASTINAKVRFILNTPKKINSFYFFQIPAMVLLTVAHAQIAPYQITWHNVVVQLTF